MPTNKKWDRVFSFASWIIVLALIYACVNIWLSPPSGLGPVAQLVSVGFSTAFYSTMYGLEALLLAYSKFFKKKKMRKTVLMVIYITALFTTLLTYLLIGWTPKLIDNIIVGIAAAGCWLYWKFKTEYINTEEFNRISESLRTDLPPESS